MNLLVSIIEMSFTCILILSAWSAGLQASRLAASGSAERLHRKARKLLFGTGLLTVAALIAIGCIASVMASAPSEFGDDSGWLSLPLTAAPMLAVWLIAVPKVWRLWKQTRDIGGPLDTAMRSRLTGSGRTVRLYQSFSNRWSRRK